MIFVFSTFFIMIAANVTNPCNFNGRFFLDLTLT